MFNGKGIYSFSDGTKYIGNFLNNDFSGQGKVVDKNGHEKEVKNNNGTSVITAKTSASGIVFIILFILSLGVNIILAIMLVKIKRKISKK